MSCSEFGIQCTGCQFTYDGRLFIATLSQVARHTSSNSLTEQPHLKTKFWKYLSKSDLHTFWVKKLIDSVCCFLFQRQIFSFLIYLNLLKKKKPLNQLVLSGWKLSHDVDDVVTLFHSLCKKFITSFTLPFPLHDGTLLKLLINCGVKIYQVGFRLGCCWFVA